MRFATRLDELIEFDEDNERLKTVNCPNLSKKTESSGSDLNKSNKSMNSQNAGQSPSDILKQMQGLPPLL